MNNKQRKIILIALASLFVVVVVIGLFISYNSGNGGSLFKPKESELFLSNAEKEYYGLDKDTKAQAFYDENGELTAYKIIKNDSDIVLDPVKEGLVAPIK